MIVRVTITDRSYFDLTVPGNNFTKFTDDIIKAGGLEVIMDGDPVWYPVTAIKSIRLLELL